MRKIAIVYWSGTGNTEAMAAAVAEGVQASGAEAVPAILSVSLPFLPKDMLSVIGAYYLAKALNSRMRRVRAA